jgi:hypothetical protein
LERSLSAIHLRTADRGTDGAIAAWLRDHGVSVVSCADPFEACVVALTQSTPAPDLAFVGVEWLAHDELAIIGYLRQTWPELTIVLYGSAPALAGFQASPLGVACRTSAALKRMLAESPENFLAEFETARRSRAALGDAWRPRPQLAPPNEQPSRAPDEGLPRPTIETRDVDLLAAELAPRVGGPDAAPPTAPPTSPAHEILTPEELAALLEDD